MTNEIIPGVLLAGGLARRMGGGDKPMRTIGGRTILTRVIARLAPQCDQLILNANGDPSRFAAFGLPVVADDIEGFAGPLAGVLAALDWSAAHRPDIDWVLSTATDCPFLPRDLLKRLHQARVAEDAHDVTAIDGHVEMDHVDFSYVPGVPILHDVSLTARPGQKIGLFGPKFAVFLMIMIVMRC